MLFGQTCVFSLTCCYLPKHVLALTTHVIWPDMCFLIDMLLFTRHVANGEILGVTLLMEDVLQTGVPPSLQDRVLDSKAPSQAESVIGDNLETDRSVMSQRSHSSVLSDLKEASRALGMSAADPPENCHLTVKKLPKT